MLYNAALKLLSGSVTAQAITLAATPFLTRLYSPEQFGVLAVFLSMVSVFGVVGTLRFDNAIPLAKSDEVAPLFTISLFVCSFYTALLVCFFLIIEKVDTQTLPQYKAVGLL